MNATETVERKDEAEKVEFPVLTPYKLAQLATAIARKQGKKGKDNKPLKLAPQTLYGMSDRGTLKVVRDDSDKQFVPSDEGERIVREFLAGRLAGRTQQRVDIDALAAKFGEVPGEPEGDEPGDGEPEDLTDQLRAAVEAAGGEVPQDEAESEEHVEDEAS